MSDTGELLDMEVIGALQSLQRPGAPSVLDRVVAAFQRSGEGLMTSLDDALAAGDLDAFKEAAHSLKSGSANVGARTLSDAAREGEMAAREGDLEGARSAYSRLREDWPRVMAALADLSDAGAARATG